MPVLSAVIDRGPFRASTAPPYYHPETIDSIFCKLSVDPRRAQAAILQYDKPQSQYFRQFDLLRSQIRAGTNLLLLRKASQQPFPKQQRLNAICV
ncbi:hypothetical protein TNCV_3307311 [Trichonephila clavipes]|nr:hypothetical protein TNCV_3307311 [Trichonephila clavipes]